jgi:hypothetical protein
MLSVNELNKLYRSKKEEKKLEFIKQFEIENSKLIEIWEFEMKKGINNLEKYTTIPLIPEMVKDSCAYLQNLGFIVGIPTNYLTHGNLYVYWDYPMK